MVSLCAWFAKLKRTAPGTPSRAICSLSFECVICLGAQEGKAATDWVATIPCGHIFHRACLENWATASSGAPLPNWTCPLCRYRVHPDPHDLREYVRLGYTKVCLDVKPVEVPAVPQHKCQSCATSTVKVNGDTHDGKIPKPVPKPVTISFSPSNVDSPLALDGPASTDNFLHQLRQHIHRLEGDLRDSRLAWQDGSSNQDSASPRAFRSQGHHGDRTPGYSDESATISDERDLRYFGDLVSFRP